MPHWSDARNKRPRSSAPIPTATDLVNEYEQLAAQLPQVRAEDEQHNRDPRWPGIVDRLRALEGEIAASVWTFTFQAVGRQAYRGLMNLHAPTEAESAEFLADNPGTKMRLAYGGGFPPALLSASAVSVVDAAGDAVLGIDWADLWDTWSVGQTAKIWATCMAANSGVAEVPKPGAGYAQMGSSEPS